MDLKMNVLVSLALIGRGNVSVINTLLVTTGNHASSPSVNEPAFAYTWYFTGRIQSFGTWSVHNIGVLPPVFTWIPFSLDVIFHFAETSSLVKASRMVNFVVPERASGLRLVTLI